MSRATVPTPARKASRLRRWLPPTWQQRKRTFTVCAWIILAASYLAIIFAFVFPHDLRNSAAAYVWAAWTAFMIRTFLFHLGLLVGVGGLVALLARRGELLAAALPLLAFTLGPVLWSYVPKRVPALAGKPITVMSVNLLAQNRRTGPIVAEVVAAKPDVLLLQEYTPNWHRAFQDAIGPDYPHTRYQQRGDSFGLAIYSRWPFAGPLSMSLPLGTAGMPQARAAIRIAGRDVAFYNIHLMPPKSRAHTARQRREFADLLELLKREDLPVVLCGDFNFTNASVFADELKRIGLIDAHRISGWGRGATWSVRTFFRYLPGLRIDHMFLSEQLTSTRDRTGVGRGSDHRPIIAEVGFAR